MPDTSPESRVAILEASTRNEYARHIIAGFRSAMPTLASVWDYLEDALSDVQILHALLDRLAGELAQTRLDRANLLAAMQAAIAAHADHEPDPLWYLRDELDAARTPHGGPPCPAGRRG